MNKSRNSYLYLAIAIPIIMVAIVVFNIMFYGAKLTPQYHFIYYDNNKNINSWTCYEKTKKEIFPDKIKINNNDSTTVDCSNIKLYEYNFSDKKSTEVTLAQVKQMKLSSTQNRVSPDGYSIGYCNSTGTIDWFPGYSSNSICIRKDKNAERVNIPVNSAYFIGWKLNQ